jgi:hypothetical protein
MAAKLQTSSTPRILYRNAVSSGYWPASIVDDTVFQCDVSGAQNSVPGWWSLHVSCVLSGGDTATPGEAVFLQVHRLYVE